MTNGFFDIFALCFCSDSYPTQQSGGGYQSRQPNPFAQQDNSAYEMTDYSVGNTGAGDSMSDFYTEVRSNYTDWATERPILLARFLPSKTA